MRKLTGAVQLVVNMLRRDGTPVRIEAATELLGQLRAVESELTMLKNKLETSKKKRKLLWDTLNKIEFCSDRMIISSHPSYKEIQNVLDQTKIIENSEKGNQ